MKNIITFILLVVAGAGMVKAQDTIFPVDPTYPLYNQVPVRKTSNYAENSFHIPSRNTIAVVKYVLPPGQQLIMYGLAIPIYRTLEYGQPNPYTYDTTDGAFFKGVYFAYTETPQMSDMIFTPESIYMNHPRLHDARIVIPRWVEPCVESIIDTAILAFSMYFDEPIILSDSFFVGTYEEHAFGGWLAYGYGGIDCSNQLPNGQYEYTDNETWNGAVSGPDSILFGPRHVSITPYTPMLPLFTLPDTDSFGCPEVEGFGFAGMSAGSPTFVWDTAGEHELYQIAYGPYDAPLDSLLTRNASSYFIELFDNTLTPDVYYQARLRARCHHQCPIHDTVMWTAWSDPVYFYTGDHMPDTTHHTQPEGIAAPEEALPFAIVPNPSRAGTRQVVEIGQQVPLQGLTLTLHDAAGHEVLRMEVKEHRFALPVQGLPAGVYMVTLASPQGKAPRRVVVE